MRELLTAIGYVVLLSGTGSALTAWLFPRTQKTDGRNAALHDDSAEPAGWGWAFLLGTAASGFLLYLPLALTGSISSGYFVVVVAICLALTAWSLYRQFSPRGAVLAFRRSWLFDLPWQLACLVLAVFVCGAVSVATTRTTGFDARATFLMKAKLLYDVGTIRGEDFQDVNRMHFNAHYPLLLPLHEATIFHLQQSTNDRCTRVMFLAFLIALSSVVAREFRRWNSRRTAALISAALLCIPLVIQTNEGAGLTSAVDTPLACFATAGVLACMSWLRTQDSRQAILSAAMLGAAALTKSEGAIWIIAVGTAMLLLVLFRRVSISRSVWKSCGVGIGLLVAVVAVSLAVRRQIPYSPYLRSYAAAALDWNWLQQLGMRPLQVALFAIRDLLRPGFWNFGWLCVAAAFILRRKERVPTDVLFARLSLTVVGLVIYAVFVITPYHVYWQMSTAMYRLVLQVLPLAWILAAENLRASGWLSKFEGLWDHSAGVPAVEHEFDLEAEMEPHILPLRRAG